MGKNFVDNESTSLAAISNPIRRSGERRVPLIIIDEENEGLPIPSRFISLSGEPLAALKTMEEAIAAGYDPMARIEEIVGTTVYDAHVAVAEKEYISKIITMGTNAKNKINDELNRINHELSDHSFSTGRQKKAGFFDKRRAGKLVELAEAELMYNICQTYKEVQDVPGLRDLSASRNFMCWVGLNVAAERLMFLWKDGHFQRLTGCNTVPDNLYKTRLLVELCMATMISLWFHHIGEEEQISENELFKGKTIALLALQEWLDIESVENVDLYLSLDEQYGRIVKSKEQKDMIRYSLFYGELFFTRLIECLSGEECLNWRMVKFPVENSFEYNTKYVNNFIMKDRLNGSAYITSIIEQLGQHAFKSYREGHPKEYDKVKCIIY